MESLTAIASLITAFAALATALVGHRQSKQTEKFFHKTYTGFLNFTEGDVSQTQVSGEIRTSINLEFVNVGPGKILNFKPNVIAPYYIKIVDCDPEIGEVLDVDEDFELDLLIPNDYLSKTKTIDIEIQYRNVLGKEVAVDFTFEIFNAEIRLVKHIVES